jgi:type II secretory pathway pseudopilin PulG
MYTQSGSAFVYILIAIALLAALTVTTMQPSSQQSQTQNATQLVSELNSQIGFIQSAVQECVITYPGGDSGVNTGDDSNDISPTWGANSPYPVNPDAGRFSAAPPPADRGPAGNRNVKNLRCPGNPGDNPDHADIFGGSSGRFLPPKPDIFEEGWKWYNGKDGVFFWIETDKSDPFITTAFEKLNGQMAECQVDWDTNLSMPDDDAGDSGSVNVPECSSDHDCLRYWMVIDDTAPSHSESCP